MRFLSQSSALARFDLSRMWVLGVAPHCERTRMHLTHTHTHTQARTHTDIYTLNAAVAVAVAVAFARVAISGWVSVVISAAA